MDSVVLVVKGESGKQIAAAQVRGRDLLLRVGGLIAAKLDASKVPKERVEKDGEASWVYVIDLPLLWEIQETLPNLISQLRTVRPAWFEWLEREIPRHHASRNAQPRLAKLSGAEAISWAESNDAFDASPAGHPWHGLRSYQQAGVRWLNIAHGRAILGDDMGLGKTSESLTYLQLVGAERVLVVCPSVVLINWQREAARWAPAIAFTPIRSQEELAAFIARPHLPRRFAVSVSWGLLRLVKDALIGLRFDTVVADEIHYASNPESQRTQALLELGMQPWCERRLGLTGTEVRNRPKELWPLLRFVDPLRFRVFARYGERFCGPKNKKVPIDGKQVMIREYNGVSKIRELNELLRGYAIRRDKKQVLTEIPEKTRQMLPVPWTVDEQRTVAVRFERIKKKIGLDGTGEQLWAMGQLTELRKEAGLAKVPIATELIADTVRSGEPVIVFLYHHEVREALEKGLAEAGISSLSIVGETPPKKRDEYVQAFQDGKADVIIGSTAMKEGVTLHRARITLHVERFWVPADEEQAEDRACRFGQRRAVLNWYLHLEGSMDDYMAKVIEAKREILNALHDRSDHATQRVLLDMIARGEA